MLKALMPVVCVDTALYALSRLISLTYSIEDPAQLGSSDAPREICLDKVASMLETYLLGLS